MGKVSPIIKKFREAVLERSKKIAPGYASMKLEPPTMGESIIRILKRGPIGAEKLRKEVRKMSKELYIDSLYDGLLQRYLDNGLIYYNEQTKEYSLGKI